jgi:flagellar basal-body rod modification protein FlgD
MARARITRSHFWILMTGRAESIRMATSPISTTGSSANAAVAATGKNSMTSDDFIKMMITQLQHQDPLQPASNQELMSQMSQIGQLQSTTQLQTTLTGLALQNQIGAGANLIGKSVQGLDENNDAVEGIVSSIKVQNSQVSLELNNGKTVGLDHVTSISPAPASAPAPAAAGAAPIAA